MCVAFGKVTVSQFAFSRASIFGCGLAVAMLLTSIVERSTFAAHESTTNGKRAAGLARRSNQALVVERRQMRIIRSTKKSALISYSFLLVNNSDNDISDVMIEFQLPKSCQPISLNGEKVDENAKRVQRKIQSIKYDDLQLLEFRVKGDPLPTDDFVVHVSAKNTKAQRVVITHDDQDLGNGIPRIPNDNDWATLHGRFVLDGDLPKRKGLFVQPVSIGGAQVFDESLIVHPQNRGIANVVVQVDRKRDEPPLFVHPEYAKRRPKIVYIHLRQFRVNPHVSLIMTGQNCEITNFSNSGCNTNIQFLRPGNRSINPIIPPKSKFDFTAIEAEMLPVPLSDSIHPWIAAKLVVLDHPYAAVTNNDGAFIIRNLPPGPLTFRVWHESSGFVTKVKRKNKMENWRRGRFPLQMEPGSMNLGEVLVDAAIFR